MSETYHFPTTKREFMRLCRKHPHLYGTTRVWYPHSDIFEERRLTMRDLAEMQVDAFITGGSDSYHVLFEDKLEQGMCISYLSLTDPRARGKSGERMVQALARLKNVSSLVKLHFQEDPLRRIFTVLLPPRGKTFNEAAAQILSRT